MEKFAVTQSVLLDPYDNTLYYVAIQLYLVAFLNMNEDILSEKDMANHIENPAMI